MPHPPMLQGTIDMARGRRNGPAKGRATVTGGKDDRLKGSIKGDAARRERLAHELRENLKRRKAQARAKAESATQSGDDGDPSTR